MKPAMRRVTSFRVFSPTPSGDGRVIPRWLRLRCFSAAAAVPLPEVPESLGSLATEEPEKKKEKKKRRRRLTKGSTSSSASGYSETAEIVRWNKVITGHMRWGRCEEASQAFDAMPRRTTVSWNAMLSGYITNDRFELALHVFRRMPHRDLVSWNTMISGFVRNGDLSSARRLFDEMPDRDIVSWNAMISAYAQYGQVDAAREMFDRAPVKNAITWNGLLAAYVQNGRLEAARKLFDSSPEWETEARELFDRMPRRDVVSWNTMVSGYAQAGELGVARLLFDRAPTKDVFTWTAMLSGYAQNGMLEEARRVFDKMPEKNEVSWNAMIAGYVQHCRMEQAMELFGVMPCRNISSWNTMITGYAQNGELSHARKLFDEMPRRDSISWAAMIAGHSQSGLSEEALGLFIEMGRLGERLNRSAYTCALSTCADIAALECGRQVHGRLVKAGYAAGCFVGNALLAMYCKCGSIDEAYDAFMEMPAKDVVTWNTMIAGFARHGFGREALEVFDWMLDLHTRPDDVTLVGVLSACGHAGLVEKGIGCFYAMERDFGITPKPQHYTCMIDLLGRAGRMPFEPDATMWGALLGASRIHGDTELGESAARRIFEMEPENSGMYVLLSNLYAAAGKWADVGRMRVMMRDKGVRKVPGFSWIEVQNVVHTFSVGDAAHPQKEEIYAFLEDLDRRLKKAGHVSVTKTVLHDVEEEEKEQMLKYHSERLAVAFGILRNLRVCEDCHSAIKYISAMEGRLIILRDSNRFHHFSGGSCSCGDYW
ncbi:unnamed protein product [Spirodela intermedia]|uniref:DYW domain-containing protein n=1 Tax=Spirodela intermedia TaxID=51605 RepID=A0A7I8JNK2_SPIIN|nr:unnamed protein product [Spirodela intermedia]CAA6671355.1 unnamed protein product [Spirodela intermedia]